MDLSKLEKPEFLLLCEEPGIEVCKGHNNPQIVEAINECGAEEDEISESSDAVQQRNRKAAEDAKKQKKP